MRSDVRSLVALLLAVTVLVYPTSALADEAGGTAAEGAAAGRSDGRADTNSLVWVGAGCLLPWGVMAAYLIMPNPPAARLLGKSPEYVAAYTEAYRASVKHARACGAWIGTAAAVVPSTVLVLFAYAFFSYLSHGPYPD